MPTSLNQPSSTSTVRHPKRALRTSNARGPSGPEAEQSFLEDPSDDEQEDDAVPSRPAVPAFRWRKPPPLLVSDSILSHTKAALPAHAADARSITNECTPKLGPQPAAAAAAASSTSKPTSPPLVKLNLVSNAEAETLVGRGSIAPNPLRESIDYHVQLAEQLAGLGLSGKRKSHGPLVWSNDDLEFIHDLGAGNGGTVAKVRHGPTNQVMAKKTVFIDAQPGVRKQILRELQIMHECCHPCIIGFYGAYQNEPFHICMCMEYMDKGSLDQIYKYRGPIPYPVCSRVAGAVIKGLAYLYDEHRILHRDVKPSNILANSQGQLKLCDFGLSGELANSRSVANTFVGTSAYMAPERIQGGEYTIKSDIWSLGMTLVELALGHFPISDEGQGISGILDLLQTIVHEPSARLPEHYEPELRSVTDACLLKNPKERPAPNELLSSPLITSATADSFDLAAWLNMDF